MVVMRNPLSKRFKRELRDDFGKYAVIFILLVLTIGFVSGYLVAGVSMMKTYDESFEKYNIEDGNFIMNTRATPAQMKAIESYDVSLYENFYVQKNLTNQTLMRIFKIRDKVNLVCVMAGRLPQSKDEIALDRLYARNNHLAIGDTISDGTITWTITGTVALSDYSTLFVDNNDTMFDSQNFGVGIVTEESFETLKPVTYNYAWKYNVRPGSDEEEKKTADELMKNINQEAALEQFVPQYANQAIHFTGDDMGGDKQMMEILLYIITVIIAFVFAITTKDTIAREANVIGTLRASGYTKREMITHYMTMPLIVTLIAAVIGNILGYTFLKDVCASLYYNSYSLTTYTTIWSFEALLKTTIIPIIIVIVITYLILRKSLSLSPLQFLRRDLKKGKRKNALRLNRNIPFFTRFRMRITIQNIGNYVTLFVGILFANILLMFGILLPTILKEYQVTVVDSMFAKYQYILTIPANAMDDEKKTESLLNMMQFSKAVETDNETAEKFSVYVLKTLPRDDIKQEEFMLYGIQQDSNYVHLDLKPGDVIISSLLADKYEYRTGDTFTLKEPYDDETYDFRITGIADYEGSQCIFMNQKDLNERFDLGDDFFAGYFSDTEITDIPDKYIGTVLDQSAMTKVSRQLMISMGSMMYLVDGFSVIIFIVLMYILSKIIIEKNTQSISMTKILGYTNAEISRLYIFATSIMVVVSLLASLPLASIIIEFLWRKLIKSEMSGWMMYRVNPSVYIKMITLGIACYVVVAVLEMHKIKKIPMDEALKNVE